MRSSHHIFYIRYLIPQHSHRSYMILPLTYNETNNQYIYPLNNEDTLFTSTYNPFPWLNNNHIHTQHNRNHWISYNEQYHNTFPSKQMEPSIIHKNDHLFNFYSLRANYVDKCLPSMNNQPHIIYRFYLCCIRHNF